MSSALIFPSLAIDTTSLRAYPLYNLPPLLNLDSFKTAFPSNRKLFIIRFGIGNSGNIPIDDMGLFPNILWLIFDTLFTFGFN